MSDNPPEQLLDVTELLCPLPVLKAWKRLQDMESGSVLRVVATDPMSAIDMPHFCIEQGHTMLSHKTVDRHQIFRIRRK